MGPDPKFFSKKGTDAIFWKSVDVDGGAKNSQQDFLAVKEVPQILRVPELGIFGDRVVPQIFGKLPVFC